MADNTDTAGPFGDAAAWARQDAKMAALRTARLRVFAEEARLEALRPAPPPPAPPSRRPWAFWRPA